MVIVLMVIGRRCQRYNWARAYSVNARNKTSLFYGLYRVAPNMFTLCSGGERLRTVRAILRRYCVAGSI
ncbi:hypothetical protein D8M23_01940 [Rothia sp. HSID18067]|nr:hypothetical protein D8M23_01940 [Rothia sp. HSID18067]